VIYVVAKVKAATMALYPLTLQQEQAYTAQQTTIVYALHLANNSIGFCFMELASACYVRQNKFLRSILIEALYRNLRLDPLERRLSTKNHYP
jgi:hypothetical protein